MVEIRTVAELYTLRPLDGDEAKVLDSGKTYQFKNGAWSSVPVVALSKSDAAPSLSAATIPVVESNKMDTVASVPGAAVSHMFGSGGTGAAAGAGMGAGGLIAGGLLGGIGGLVLGSLVNGNGGLLGNNNRNGEGAAVALGSLEFMEQLGDIKTAIALAPQAAVLATANSQGAIQTQLANANLNTLQSVDALGSTLQASATQALIQNLNSFNGLQAATQTGFNTANIIAQNGFNNLGIQSMESASDIKAAIATQTARAELIAASAALELQKCCCETQKAIQASTQAILDQNNSFRTQDLQIENSNLRQTLSLRDVAAAQTATILQHLAPHSPVIARTV